MSTHPTPSSFSRFRRVISMRPYAQNLLTPGAANWIFMTRLVVVIMALSEAISWGYLGGLFLTSGYKYISAGIAGSFVFLIIWSIDVSLMTLDRARPFYELALYHRKAIHPRRDKLKEISAFVFRWVIVTASLYITAPFLAQIIFGVDIRREIQAETTQIIQTARTTIEDRHAKAIQAIQEALANDRAQLTQEVAGRLRNGSGLYGEGPVARTIKDRIRSEEVTLSNLEKERTSELSLFDSAVGNNNYEELRKRWGVVAPENSIVKKGEVLAKIVQVPTYTRTELAIRAFLFLLFLSLFILKLFEPRSVKVYLSEALQQEWARYKAGAFNSWLSADEKSNAETNSMTAYRFEDLMINVYPVVREEDMTRRQSAKLEIAARDGIGRLEEIKTEINVEVQRELAAAQQRLTDVNSTLANLTGQRDLLSDTIALAKKDVARCEANMNSFDPSSSGSIPEAQKIQNVKLRALRIEAETIHLEALNKLEQAEQKLLTLEGTLNKIYSEKTQLTARINELNGEIREVNKGLEEIRKRRIDDAINRGKGDGNGTKSDKPNLP